MTSTGRSNECGGLTPPNATTHHQATPTNEWTQARTVALQVFFGTAQEFLLQKPKSQSLPFPTQLQVPSIMATLTNFHQFSQLPPEIRNIIWELSLNDLKPRIVYLQKLGLCSEFHWGQYSFRYTVPPLLQACRESRAWAQTVYQQTISCRRRGPGRRLDRSYVWLNFDRDMVEIQCSDITSRIPQAKQIKHLRIVGVEKMHCRQYTGHEIYDLFWANLKLAQFIRLEKLHIFTNLDVIGCEPQVQTYLKRGLTCGIRILNAFRGDSRDTQNYRHVAWEEAWHFFSNNKTNFWALAQDANAALVMADEPIELPKDKNGKKLNILDYWEDGFQCLFPPT